MIKPVSAIANACILTSNTAKSNFLSSKISRNAIKQRIISKANQRKVSQQTNTCSKYTIEEEELKNSVI